MPVETSAADPTKDSVDFASLYKRFVSIRSGSSFDQAAAIAVFINFFMVFIRPQNELEPLATIQLPLLVGLIPFGFWLTKLGGPWTSQMKAMAAIAIMGGLWIPFALNNRWAYEGFRNIFQLFVMFIFPLCVFVASGKQLRRLVTALLLVAGYSALYGVTHSGKGQGDFLGDENDLCFALVMYLGFALAFLSMKLSTMLRTATFVTTAILFVAIIVTGSRGGFLGMVACAIFVLYFSRQKAVILGVVAFFGLASLVLAPSAYWERIKTIRNTDDGSAKERIETWNFCWDIYTRRDIFLFGGGMKNTQVYLGGYKTSTSRNLWGRRSHSLYFELLPDLGTVGFGIFLWMVVSSIKSNRRFQRQSKKLEKGLKEKLKELSVGNVLVTSENSLEDGKKLIRGLMRELDLVNALCTGANAAWIGTLVAAAFVSVLYYPPLWFLAGVSAALGLYSKKLMPLVQRVLEMNSAAMQTNAPANSPA